MTTTAALSQAIPTEERIELARYYVGAAHRAVVEFRDLWRTNAQSAGTNPLDMRAYWLWQFSDFLEAACAAIELDAQEREKWRAVERDPRTWEAIGGKE